jgi:mRNA-degrading endonuclease RelE of RelBE toxin-antitoxin system
VPVIITDRFLKAYDDLPPEARKKVKQALGLLDADPRHPSLQVHPIKGCRNIFVARVDQMNRISFVVDGDNNILRNVDNHEACVKNP